MKKFFISIFILAFSVNLFAQTETNLQANDDELQSLLEARQKAVEAVSATNNTMSSSSLAGQVSADSTWVEKTGSDNLLNGIDVGSYAKPAVVDIDNDGDYDVFIGSNSGIMWYFKNTGTKSSPVLTQQTTVATYPLYNKNIGAEVNPTFVDIDGDGDLDLFNGISGGTLRYYKNTGTTSVPNFAEQTTVATHPLYGKDFGSLAAPVFVDIDNDGDYDFFAGHSGGTIYYYENTGTKSAPVFAEKTGASNPFNNVDVGNYSQPTFVDIDNDGDHDALIGASDGLLYFYKNEGSAATATFTAKTGANNPFNGIDAGIEAAPEFADMDGDGDVDMFVGESQGKVKYFIQNLGDNTAPAAPTVVTTTPGNSSILVTWKQNTEGDLSLYKIYGGESSNPTTVAATSAKGTSSASFSAENGTTYYGHMTAVDTSGNESSKSAEAMVMPHNVDSTLSMSFDGTDDYVSVPDNDSLKFGTGNFAFSAWFRLDKVTGTQQIISKRASGSGNFEFQISTNKLGVYIGNDGWAGSTALSKDTWYHVLVTRSGSAVKAYLNGSEEVSSTSSASVTSTAALTFGKDTAGDEYLDGIIEDVAIWNTAISANSASAIYNSGTPIDLRNNNGNYAESANLKGYWRFSEGSGTLAHDFSGKGNHGTVSGAAWSSTVPTGSKVSTITGLTAEAAYRSVKLDWNSATNASEYHVYKSTDNSSFSKLADASTDSLDVTGLAAGTKYYFKVSGVNSDSEEGPSSASVSATPNRIFWVDDVNGSDNYNGKTKKAAFKTVHKILENNSSLLSGDTIKVMPSVVAGSPNGYYDFGNDRIETVHSRNFVMIGVAGADSTIFDAEDKSRHFWFDDGQTDSTVIKGISFKHGMADNSSYYGGGSIYIGNNTHIKFEDCVWDSNYVKDYYYGGAISIGRTSNTSFTGCTFQNNHAEEDDGGTYGGAVWIHSTSSKDQLNAAIKFKQTKFINNWVIAEHSAYGGAVYSDRSTEFINCLFVKNYVIAGNGANANDGHEGVGGAIHSQPTWWNGSSYEPGTMKIVNSTFHGNYTDVKTNNGQSWSGTIAYGRWNNASTNTYLFNTIVSGSRTLRGGSDIAYGDVEDRILGTGNDTPKLNTYRSNIVGSTGRKWVGDYTYDTVPVYTDTLLEDYRLSDKSPLIGNGEKRWDDEGIDGPTVDLLGLSRPYPSGSSPDMGAYENSLASSSSPLPVAGFVATRSTNGAKLSWTKNKKSLSSDDDAENVQYQIYADGLLKASTASLAYNLSGLTNGITYKISVAALDTTTKLEGAQSIAISVTPKYLGPWYVAAATGAAVSDTSSSDDVGSTNNPLSHLKGAIEIAASGDTIILQEGTHSGSSDRGRDWGNTKSLVIMGDPALTADKIIIDAKGKDRHFTFDNNEDTTTQIIGLTLKNGYDTDYGGSIRINYASVKLKGVIFENNYSDANDYYAAGAVSAYNTSTIIDSCIFDGNYINSSEGRRGGAISVSWQNNVNEIMTVTRSTFKNNYVKAEKDAYGGAISTYYHAIRIENSVFHGNSVTSSIGSNTNYSAQGGAIYINNPSYWDSYASEYKSLNAYVINNTIVNNNLASASSFSFFGSGLSVSAYNPANIYVFNNIFRNNKNDYETAPYQNQLYFNLGEDANLYVDYNNVENFSTSFNSKDFGDYTLDVDPALTDSANGDFTLSDASLMLGAGASTYEGVAAPTVDYKGLARPNPAGSNPDIGAYENSLAKSPYPKPVTDLTAIGGSGQVTLSWEANETADSVSVYKVYKHTANFSISSTYFVDSTTTTGYIIKNLDNSTRYYFRVTAVNAKGFEGTASNTVSLTPKFSGPIWWVDTNGNDNNNEGSETNSFASIKKALESAASGDTITIKKGIHKGGDNREIRFGDSDFNKSIVIRGEPGISADSVVIDAEDNSWHFMINGANDNVIVFKDLTLKNGYYYQNKYNEMWGASVSIQSSKSVEFNNVIFRDNSSSGDVPYNPGAVSVRQGPVSFIKCQFINNKHMDDSNHANGGAVYVGDWALEGDIIFDQCTFKENLTQSTTTGNDDWGAALGSAIYWDTGKGKITNSLFVSNVSRSSKSQAAGVVLIGRTSINQNNSSVLGSVEIVNNTFYNNKAYDGFNGGNTNNPVLHFELWGDDESRVTAFNNIIWDNYSNDALNPRPIRDWGLGENANVHFGYNNVQNWDQIDKNADHYNFESNYSLNPGFVDTSKQDYRLSDKSALIGLGASTFNSKSAPSNDRLGNMRPSPSGSNPDLGAYENSLESSPYPQQVKHLHYTPASESVSLFWDANTDKDLEKYQIYMSTAKGFVPSKADSIGSTSDTTYLVTGLTNKLEYYFRVAAKDSSGYLGDYSEELMAIPQYRGPTWWVSDNAGMGGDGSSLSPMGSVREALDTAAPGDTIRILTGTYSGPDNVGLIIDKDISIIGDGPALTELSATNNNFHFKNIPHGNASNDSLKSYKVYFSGIKFSGSSVGYTGQDGETSWVGAIRVDDLDSFIISNSIFEGNTGSGTSGAAVVSVNSNTTFDHVVFRNNRVETNQDSKYISGGAVAIINYSSEEPSTVNINNSVFDNNELVIKDTDAGGQGGALLINGPVHTTISHSVFNQNHLRINANNSFGSGAAIFSYPYDMENSSWNDYGIKIEQSTFTNNYINTQTNSSGAGGVIMAMNVPVTMINSVVANNSSVGNNPGPLFELRGIPDQAGNSFQNEFINNTIVDNKGTYAFIGANNVNESANNEFINNIFWDNDSPGFTSTTAEKTHVRHNIMQDNTSGEFLSEENIIASPLFKNKAGGNYQLSKNSPAIDAGEPSEKIFVDHRGYFRTNTPDIGAFEAGASKYLLTIADDIDTDDSPIFVKLNQQMTLTLNTKDLSGNLVGSGDSVRWNIFPSGKYVSIEKSDSVINAGLATAVFRVSSLEKSKGFKFRVEAELSGDAFITSDLYVIEEIVTGSPPPVLDLTISPESWTRDPDFTLNWKTPVWDKQRELLGLVMESNDGFNKQQEFYPFPTGDTLITATFEAPEAGEFELKVWLVDELGNESIDSSRVIKAYFDDVNPDPYEIHDPDSYQNTHYTSDRPRFEWAEAGDYPSGIKEWRIYTKKKPVSDDKLYGKYMYKDVTIDDGDVIVQDTISLNDGFYDWWLVAEDHAGNITNSDTGFFGVDLSPPNITHTNPLTQIDENTTSPAINATFSDGASGVMTGRLHYRRAGAGGGFVAQDLLAGPFNIPGSDIKAVGLEYYIDSEDSLGNYGKWPSDKAFQSVKVRTEAGVSTAGNLNLPGGTDSTNFVFFSIPFDIGNGISAFKAMMDPQNEGPDEFKYRLYAYNNGWQENPSSLTMGNGYFFIFDPDKYSEVLPLQFDFGQGVSTSTDPPYQINVTPGQWKFFGLPYNFNIPMSDIYTETGASLNDAGSIYTWNSQWSGAGSTLQPWKGYIFKSGGDTKLNIDARGSMFGKMAKASVADNGPMDGNEWIVDIIATTGNTRDEMNSVGVRHIAEDGYDRLDEFEPPVVPGNISLRIDNRDREVSPDLYSKDIRKPNETGHYWDLQVFTPTNGQRTYLTFEGLGYIPQEYDIFIINKTNKQAKNLEWESTYRFANTGSKGYLKQDLRLVIGTKEFVKENNAGVNLYPDAFTLSQNYPNPFNPQTSIMLSLEEDAQVDLIIYNLLGEEVTRLAANEYRPAGYYNFIWNGRNSMGTKVSTGVYFYHAMIRDSHGKTVLNKTKKMIFLK